MRLYYYKIRCFVAFGLLLISSSVSYSIEGKYPILNFRPGDYGAGIQNIAFAQNRDMTLFVANNLGVLSYNGIEWSTHAMRTGKKQRSLAFDEKTDRLYVGSQGEFGYFEKNWNYVSLLDKIPNDLRDFDEVWDVFAVENQVYFCTFQGIYTYSRDTILVTKNISGFNKSFIVGNRLFTQNAEGQLVELRDQVLVSDILQSGTGQIVSGILQHKDGHILFYNSGKIELSTPFGVAPFYQNLMEVLEGKYVNHVVQLSDSRIVISTQRAGLFIFNQENFSIENVGINEGLQSNACLRSYQDYAGNLWVGMQNGLALVDINSPMRLINQEINLQGSGYDVFETDEGTYYTTSNGIYFLSKDERKCRFIKGTEGPAYGLQRILDKLYAGHHSGLFLLENGAATRIAVTDGLWRVRPLVQHPGYAIGGTYSGLYLFKVSKKMQLEGVGKIRGFEESSRFFEEDNRGRIWVGQFYKGLYQLTLKNGLQEAAVSKVSGGENIPIQKHIILTKIDDQLLLGTEEGIYTLDQNTDRIVPSNYFYSLIGKLWIYLLAQSDQKITHVVTENGVGFIKKISSDNYVYVPSSLFRLRHSFNNDLLNISGNVSHGVLFNANEGFIHYDPDKENRFTNPIKPILTKVYGVAEDRVLFERLPFEANADTIKRLVIGEGVKVLQFKAETFEYANSGNKRFRFFLKGFDLEYSEWTTATTKEYTNLKEGEYEFFVQTLNSFGEEVTSDPVLLKVFPPFYKSKGMKILYGVFFLIMLVQAYRIQKKAFTKKTQLLEKDKQEAITQKQYEVQRLKEDKIQTELRHVNNLLAASTMNLVVKNEFMETIKEELKEVNLNGTASDRRVALEKIVKEIETSLRVNDDWKQFEYHFDQVHGDFLTRLTHEFTDLTPGEQKLCAFLRLKMDTKEIANLMAISLRGVEVARYRLRKKFGLQTHQNLSKFILEY